MCCDLIPSKGVSGPSQNLQYPVLPNTTDKHHNMQSFLGTSRFAGSLQTAACPRLPAVRMLPHAAVHTTYSSLQHSSRTVQHQALTMGCDCQIQQRKAQLLCQAASSSNNGDSSNSSSSSSQQPMLTWFDRLPPRVQLAVMGGLLFVGMFVIPFLQPSFLYGDSSKQPAAGQQSTTNVRQAEPSYTEKYKLPRYIPVASELYDFLQDNAMPKKLPDGRTESPGVLRIYLSSMIILGLFYACSAVLSLILNGVAGILRAVGIMGPAPPRPKEE